MAKGFVVTVFGGEMGAIETAKLKNGVTGSSLVVGVGFLCGKDGREFGFVFAEGCVRGVRHRVAPFLQAVKKDAGLAAEFVWCGMAAEGFRCDD
jgi:hypothetical protein